MTIEQWGNIELPGISDDKLLNTNWNFAKTQNDKQRRSQTLKKVAAQRDEEYTQKLHQGIARRDNTYQAIANAKPEVQAKISESMKQYQKTPEHLAKVAEKNRERSKPVSVPWGVFESGRAAGDAYNKLYGVTNGKNRVSKNIKKGTPGYKFISQKEYNRRLGLESST